jgi:hypothetical protein
MPKHLRLVYMLHVLYHKVHTSVNILIQECCHPHRLHHHNHHYHHVTFQILFKGYFGFPAQYLHLLLTVRVLQSVYECVF